MRKMQALGHAELVKQLHEDFPHLTEQDIKRFLGSFFNYIIHGLESGCRVLIHPFGGFGLRYLPPRMRPMVKSESELSSKDLELFKGGNFPTFQMHRALFSRINPHRTTLWVRNLKAMKHRFPKEAHAAIDALQSPHKEKS